MMINPLRGEISAELDGRTWTLCLTLGALANLEDSLETETLAGLAARFSSGNLSASHLVKIIHAGLLGGGHEVSEQEVADMRVEKGIAGYVDIAARLLTATFTTGNKA